MNNKDAGIQSAMGDHASIVDNVMVEGVGEVLGSIIIAIFDA